MTTSIPCFLASRSDATVPSLALTLGVAARAWAGAIGPEFDLFQTVPSLRTSALWAWFH